MHFSQHPTVFRAIRSACLFLLGLAMFAACGDPAPSQYPKMDSKPVTTTLGPGDKISVRIEYGAEADETILRDYVIDESGEIALPYIDVVVAKGKTVPILRNEIKEKLADGYLKNPIVWIDVTDLSSIQFSVMGQVQKPSQYPYRSGMSVLDAISTAGGFTGMARKNAVTVIRRAQGEKPIRYTVPVGKIQQNKAADFQIMPGDVINVPQRLL